MADAGTRQRLAAILVADAADYSRLMSVDERATVAALDAARSVFKSHVQVNDGRVVDTAGDSVLAVFETGAVSAALTIQRELTASPAAVSGMRMQFRIGIHLRDVLEKGDGTVYGDGVNIAARLQAIADAGGITVSDSVRTAVRGRVGARFEDHGRQQLKNILEAVHAFRVEAAPGEPPAPARLGGDPVPSLPEKPSIAVLPFTNLSGDPTQEYFADGITEDIITELSRFHSLFVISRNSTFTYKGKAVDVRLVAKELGVRYVLEGSIRRMANRLRVTGELIDALTGAHVWAERYGCRRLPRVVARGAAKPCCAHGARPELCQAGRPRQGQARNGRDAPPRCQLRPSCGSPRERWIRAPPPRCASLHTTDDRGTLRPHFGRRRSCRQS